MSWKLPWVGYLTQGRSCTGRNDAESISILNGLELIEHSSDFHSRLIKEKPEITAWKSVNQFPAQTRWPFATFKSARRYATEWAIGWRSIFVTSFDCLRLLCFATMAHFAVGDALLQSSAPYSSLLTLYSSFRFASLVTQWHNVMRVHKRNQPAKSQHAGRFLFLLIWHWISSTT